MGDGDVVRECIYIAVCSGCCQWCSPFGIEPDPGTTPHRHSTQTHDSVRGGVAQDKRGFTATVATVSSSAVKLGLSCASRAGFCPASAARPERRGGG